MRHLVYFILVIFITICALFAPTYSKAQEQIYLDPCMKLCLVFYADNSGSMDSAISDVHRWARSMVLIPQSNGYVEIGLVSFGTSYQVLCDPTSDRKKFLHGVDSLTTRITENDTRPHYGLQYIKELLHERKKTDSTEVQVLVIHSDYEWYDMCEDLKEVEEIIGNDVKVVLSLPAKYNVRGQGEKRLIHWDNLQQVESLGCFNILSSFPDFKKFCRKLKAIVPCG